MARRIITVASGKGGVGKSTVAVNFGLALSRVAPTILVDLDTGTSSVRNTIDAQVDRDLYHFFRRNEPLERCLTRLPDRLDPTANFTNFAFVASPLHVMEELTSLSEQRRDRLMAAINSLPCEYVVLDLRAGLDSQVLDFLPHSNSGILVFTPHHPAATQAAAEIVKALLFRKLRLLFAPTGALPARGQARQALETINALLDRVEDSYDTDIPNLDTFMADLYHAFGDAEVVQALASNVASFSVYFVLNLFDGVRDSFDLAVSPFVRSLQQHVSAHLTIHNLGWIINSPEVHRSNCEKRPIVLQSPPEPAPVTGGIARELADIAAMAGIKPSQPRPLHDYLMSVDPEKVLFEQLQVLNAMHHDRSTMQVRDNFAYILRRAVHLLRSLPGDSFGQRQLLNPAQLLQGILHSAVVASPAPDVETVEAPTLTPSAVVGETPAPRSDAPAGETPVSVGDVAAGESPARTPEAAARETSAPAPAAALGETPAPTPDAPAGETPVSVGDVAAGESPARTPEAAARETSTPAPAAAADEAPLP